MAKLSISYFLKLDLTAPYAARGGLSIALLLAGLLGAASQALAVDLPDVEAVTYDGPKVAPYEFTGDLRHLPLVAVPDQVPAERPYRPLLRPPVSPKIPPAPAPTEKAATVSGPLAPMPSPALSFPGMSRTDSCTGGLCGAGIPPDPNGDVGLNHYIQAVNDAYAIYSKTGALLEAVDGKLRRGHELPRGFKFHHLRHTAASLRLAQGDHPKVVQEMLGHARISITLDLYSHLMPSLQADSAERFEKALSKMAKA